MFSKWFSSKKISIQTPISGKLLSLDLVPDPVFSQKLTGDGVAIEPTVGIAVAPIDGKVAHQFDTKHAIIIESSNHLQILIHIGLDTVNLKGEGFTSRVQVGDQVKIGDPLIEFDLVKIKEAGYSMISPIVITNGEIVEDQQITTSGTVQAGKDELLTIHLK